MKNRVIPGNTEQVLGKDAFIVSKSDLQGKVTYCNRTLMQISGYSEPELLNHQHNILRHPDMPRAIFHLMWDTIQSGKECFAYVKNLCKNGDYYWVFANVSPDFDSAGNIAGYFSVRRNARPDAIQIIAPLYADMLAAENASAGNEAIAAGSEVLNHHLKSGKQDYESFILSI